MHRLWIALGALVGLSATALAAWAAHGAPRVLEPSQLASLQAGLALHGWHAPALLAAGLWAEQRGGLAHLGSGLVALGLLLFLAGVYSAAIAGRSLGPVAPTGGVVLMAGWALLALTAMRRG